MFRRLLLAAGLCVTLSAGCIFTEFRITMTPDGQNVRRTTESQVMDEGQPKEPAETATGLYAGRLPDDVKGNNGRYLHYASDMGSGTLYLERFRGQPDQAAVLADQQRAADLLIDLFTQWGQSEFGQHQQWAKVKAFLDGDFRRDLKNIGVRMWLGNAAGRQLAEPGGASELLGKETWARVGQIVLEQGYLTGDDLPNLMREMKGTGQAEVADSLKRFLVLALRRKAGVTDQALLDDVVKALSDEDAFEASMTKIVSATPAYKQYVAELEKRKQAATQPDEIDDPKAPTNWLGEKVLMVALPLRLFATDDHVKMTLATGVEPDATNGKWDAEAKKVSWEFQISDDLLPVVAYANWTAPDAEAQAARLGKVLLNGDPLMQYAIWHTSLTDAEKAKWAATVAGLDPSDPEATRAALEGFTFAVAPPATAPEDDPTRPVFGAKLILKSLEDQADVPEEEAPVADDGEE